MSQSKGRRAFAGEARTAAARAAAKAAWWGGAGLIARALTRPTKTKSKAPPPSSPPPPRGFFRKAWLEAFEKEAQDIAEGLYPPSLRGPGGPAVVRRTADFIADAFTVEARRRRGDVAEVRDISPPAYPAYYRQNFHFQTGGWFTADSAERYEAQVEALFSGAAGAMRRRALALLARAWRNRDQRGLKVLDLACGTGPFLSDLAAAFPRARLIGLDLSAPYLNEARKAGAGAVLVQAKAEQLPFAASSLDAVAAVYLLHELPPRVRETVAAEIARVLKPGGLFVLADSIQPADEPRFARYIEAFPAYFHEPYYAGYAKTDLAGLFGERGLTLRAEDRAFFTKAMLFAKKD